VVHGATNHNSAGSKMEDRNTASDHKFITGVVCNERLKDRRSTVGVRHVCSWYEGGWGQVLTMSDSLSNITGSAVRWIAQSFVLRCQCYADAMRMLLPKSRVGTKRGRSGPLTDVILRVQATQRRAF
jgi:hypothetical protein